MGVRGRKPTAIVAQDAQPSAGDARVVLGIDPGSRIMGYGLIRGVLRTKPQFVAAGAVNLMQERDPYARLARIHEAVLELVREFAPSEMAIEAPFFGKNAQSMLKLGRAQGVAIAAGISQGLSVVEYAPMKVKMAVTGSGEASKEQVMAMMNSQFPDNGLGGLRHQDATDALAVAFCHYYQVTSPARAGAASWERYVEQNPNRVKRSE